MSGVFKAGAPKPQAADRTPLLHNMSAPPKTRVHYAGLAYPESPVDEWDTPRCWFQNRIFGTYLTFALPIEFTLQDLERLKAESLAMAQDGTCPNLLDGESQGSEIAQAEVALMRRIEQRAQELPLPSACVVVEGSAAKPPVDSDLITTLAILSKCNGVVWLRDKTPSLQAALDRRAARLLVPPGFRAQIGRWLPEPERAVVAPKKTQPKRAPKSSEKSSQKSTAPKGTRT